MSPNTVQGSTLVFANGKSRTFQFPIADVMEYPDTAVVRLDVPPGSTLNENVFGVDDLGSIVWQVPNRKYVYADSPYTGMQRQGDHAVLFNWDGLELTVDAATGKVVREGYGR